MTTVINIKNAPKGWQNNPDYVYIGRPSKWGNPFRIGKSCSREESIKNYRIYMLASLVSNKDLSDSLYAPLLAQHEHNLIQCLEY